MRNLLKLAAAASLGVAALGVTAASADHGDRDRDRDRDRYDDRRDRDDDYRGRDRDGDRDGEYRRRDGDRYGDRYSDRRGGRPDRCETDHDHRTHHRDYYDHHPRDRYYNADPGFSVSLSFGDRGYYDRDGRYNDRYDRRGYRDDGRVVNREVYRIRGFRADAILTEEIFYRGRGYSNLVCTVTARGPDARYVPYGQLRSIAARRCSHRADIRVYA